VLGNYTITYNTASFTINPASSTATVSVSNATYDGQPHGGTATTTGAGDLTASPTVYYAGRNGTTYASSTTAPTNAGDYTASASFGGDPNHTGSQDSKDFSIGKADATISVQGYSGAYDGDAHGATGTAKGVNDEPLSGLDLGASFTNVPGGTATWTFTDATGNYNNASGTAAIVISKASSTVTVTCPTTAQTYTGAAIEPCLAKASGVGMSDVKLDVTYTNNVNAATATAKASWAGDANHTGNSGNATFEIGKASLTVKADDKSRQYSDPNLAFTVSYDGFKGTDGLSSLSGTLAFDTTATASSPVGSYDVTPKGLTSTNYTISFVKGTLTVTKEDARITYTGDTLKLTSSSSTTSATLNLAARVDEDNDNSFGDKLGTTQLKFTVYRASADTQVFTCTAAVTLTGTGTGTASCTTTTLPADNYYLKVELLLNDYYTALVESPAVTIAVPGTGFTTGGGWIVNTDGSGTRNNFGFTAKTQKGGAVQGNSLFIYRVRTDLSKQYSGMPAGEREYNWIIKSTKITSLSQSCPTAGVCSAQFSGTATVTGIDRSTGTVYNLTSTFQFQVNVTDKGEPGTNDTYAIVLKDSTGTTTYFQLGYDTLGKLAPVTISGGNIQVK
jgi:hypothetical protein